MKKKSKLGPLPDGADKYVSNLRRCLEFVQESNPSEEQLVEWFEKTFQKSERTVRDYMYTIENLGLVVKGDGKLLLSDTAKKFLQTHDNYLLYQKLDANYLGVHDTVKLLYEKPQTLNAICSYLRKNIGVRWQKATQCTIRLNWLLSLGYVVKDGPTFNVTKEGRNIVESEIEIEEKTPEHNELLDRIVEAGKLFGFFSQKEYPINHYSVDVAWKQNESTPRPFAVFEVHLKGNLSETLARLKSARTNLRCDIFLYTTKKQMLKAQSLVNTVFPELVDAIRILHWTDINELEELGRRYREVIFGKMKLGTIIMRTKENFQKVSLQKKRKTKEKE
jgi:predicted RNA-binding protein